MAKSPRCKPHTSAQDTTGVVDNPPLPPDIVVVAGGSGVVDPRSTGRHTTSVHEAPQLPGVSGVDRRQVTHSSPHRRSRDRFRPSPSRNRKRYSSSSSSSSSRHRHGRKRKRRRVRSPSASPDRSSRACLMEEIKHMVSGLIQQSALHVPTVSPLGATTP